MTEQLQTRAEHSRSLEDAEFYRAIETLKDVGLLTPLSEVESYHGRLGHVGDEPWTVDPGFSNANNDTGNYNVNRRSTLYTGEEQIARDFGHDRGRDEAMPKMTEMFKAKVRAYTPEEKQAWLDRENAEARLRWQKMDKDYRDHAYPDGPETVTMEDLEKETSIWRESEHLKQAVPDEERKAAWRKATEDLRVEIHEISSADPDAMVIDVDFNPDDLSDEQMTAYENALKALAIPLTAGSPVDFYDRGDLQPLLGALRGRSIFKVITAEEAAQIADHTGIKDSLVLQMAGAFNANRAALIAPSYLAAKLIKSREDIIVDELDIDGEPQQVPLNMEYVQRYFREAHIVGVKQAIHSGTLVRDIEAVSLFDLEKVNTIEALEADRQDTWQRLGGIATRLGEMEGGAEASAAPLMKLLQNVYAKPEALVEAAKQVDGYDRIFEGSAGNWEGFTLAQHTETVLRNFDENFADQLPVEMLAPMRLALLSHDVGKPIAVGAGDKQNQQTYNARQAADFMDKLGVRPEMKNLLLAVIGDGAELAFYSEVKGNELAADALKKLAVDTLRPLYGRQEITDGEVSGFIEMCKIMQICDGGAYTSMAVTRMKAGGRHRNAPSFNESFAQPLGLGRRGLRLKQAEEASAQKVQTPDADSVIEELDKIREDEADERTPTIPLSGSIG